MKSLNMNLTVFEATQKFPELIGIIAGWGLPQIRNNRLRRVIGSRFTLNQAIREMGLNRVKIIELLKKSGFEVIER